MPITEALAIEPSHARKGDLLVSIERTDVRKGRSLLDSLPLTIQDVARRERYTLLTFDDESTMTVEQVAVIHVERTRATDEEKLAERRQWANEALARKVEKIAARPAQLIAKLVALDSDHWVARSAIEVGMEIAEAKEIAGLMATVADLVESPDHDLDWTGAWEQVRENVLRQLLNSVERPSSRSTSIASNLEEDAKNAGRAKFCGKDFLWS